MTEISREAFDGGDLFAGGVGDTFDARTDRFAIQMDCARAALRHATAILGPGEPQRLAQNPEQRRPRIVVDTNRLAVNLESNHQMTPFGLAQVALFSRDGMYARPVSRLSQARLVAFLSNRFYHPPHGKKAEKKA